MDTLGIQREPFGLELGNESNWPPTEYTYVTLRRWERHLGLLGTEGVSAFLDNILLKSPTANQRKSTDNDVK